MKNIIKEKYFRLLLALTLIILLSFSITATELTVHFIDIGQGDSILIQKQETNVLIDGGDRYDWVAETLLGYLTDQEVEEIDAIISTHPHADHIGGLTAVMDEFPVRAIYDSGRVHTTQTYENYLLKIDALEIPFYTPRRGDTIAAGDLELQVLHPADDDVEQYSLNNASIVVRLEYREVSFLFTGDAEKEDEEEMLETGQEVQATILKVGHHGSRTSSTPPFLDIVQPEAAVIMCGEDNRFGHPYSEVIEALDARGIKIYRTDLRGHIVVTTDGTDYWIEVSKEAKPRAPPEDIEGLININTASYEELQEITGVGPAIAERIIDYREEHGPFEKIEDIMKVSRIAEGRFEQMKDEITVGS